MSDDRKVQATAITTRLLAVIVLYQRQPADSEAFRTLQVAAEFVSSSQLTLDILLYDNTPGGQDPGALPEKVKYQSSSENAGLAEAYNAALGIAHEVGHHWLLTLDQDTTIPPTFFLDFATNLVEVGDDPSVAAIVPQVSENGKMLSPYWFEQGAIPRWYPTNFHGVSQKSTYAFNSAASIRVSSLRQVGGYDPWFWLDNSDAYLFRQFQRFGKRVLVAGETKVNHDFSMMDMERRLSPSRYRNILLAESAFWDSEMGMLAGFERTARLAFRFLKNLPKRKQSELQGITWEFLKRRLFWTASVRTAAWREETSHRFPHLVEFSGLSSASIVRKKVSVCLASYNGANYIEEQMESILKQLQPDDELIIVDDASTDASPGIIRSVSDPRIRLFEHPFNCGVIATVEDALRKANGDILFLADNDDIWADTKVSQFLEAFEQNERANIVTSKVSFIDREGQPIRDDLYRNRPSFETGFWRNILRNHFQGSAMAIRASWLGAVVPFPKDAGFLHDHWIGTRNAILGGEVVYLDEPLLLYRRHGRNLSERMSRSRQLSTRLRLLRAHLLRYLKLED